MVNADAAPVDLPRWAAPRDRGLHRCIGAPLARLQGRVVLEELLTATSGFALAGAATRPGWPRMGVSSLPVRLRIG